MIQFKQEIVPGKHHLHLTDPTSISSHINNFLQSGNYGFSNEN